MAFSVLLSLYAKERPEYLRQALDSVFSQSLKADEIVLVEDGPLTPELEAVVREYTALHPEMKIVPLPQNVGLGLALNEGLKHCSNELVARMDTDDICKPHRFEHQYNYMLLHPEISVVGAWIDEFVDSPEHTISVRTLPEFNNEIIKFARWRSPLNHPVVMFRKTDVERVGSYQHVPLLEDYYLWARMLSQGYLFYNIQESLLWFRTSPDMFKRRGGLKYAMDEVRFIWQLKLLGLFTPVQACINILIRFIVRIMPNAIRSFIYKKLLRRKIVLDY
jgi:glycosyltransferase involved in cell wall biosynthesis